MGLRTVFISGINVGVFYAVSTLLSQMVLHYYPDEQASTGECFFMYSEFAFSSLSK